MRLTRQRLNRTLLRRQHLLERTSATPYEMARHLVGLQGQEPLPPYLSLDARIAGFDPADVTRALEDRTLVRLLTLRGTIHVLTADDALALRPWTQPVLDRVLRNHAPADADVVRAVVHEALADGPVGQRELADALASALPDVPRPDLGVLARGLVPLVQLPPRGTWRGPGAIVYDHLSRWVGRPETEPDVPTIVRRYLGAYGPATAADVTAWSGVTRLAPLLKAMDDLVRHEDEDGKVLFDVPGAVVGDEDTPAPVRLLGTYDNLWISHAGRDRVTEPAKRARWMGANGGVGSMLFVDGWLEGLWRAVDDRVEVLELFRDLTPAERTGLDEEVGRVEALLAG
ncbi:winged helix DNA-binding domain-containing protein [Nocardioides sp. MAH-18]|uniref:Winged helix DNA-binding domain-containing protein n=1 Tax=Nocardioides agri TaxID=2682843 RepID=A0A6L6XK30_9ACTN|nr:winged helix DNA-binding domain-containing protein [Nocardioides sp. CGMCC 1.13656]MBA2956494.1 winged helix DNA-binding domain-containing protein [Nocardioides sp. CGMCC 1.13656]MVQ47641.1 winged helix DNA-binding domain-containing protein [Nocardioides sp. MAH-18]